MPLLFLAAPVWLRAQASPETAAILARLDRLEQENRELTAEVKALRARLDGTAAQTAGPVGPPAPVAASNGGNPAGAGAQSASANPPEAPQSLEDKVAIEQQRIEEMAQTKVEASEHFPIRITGMALFNAFLDSRESGGVEYPLVATSPGPGEAGATFRQTILGLDFRGPTTFWGGSVHGNVYMDLFGTGTTLRMRTGEIEIDWLTRSIMVGVEKPIFNPREPSSLAQVGVSPLTGAGNLWLWLPQVRVEQDFHFSQNTGLRAQMGVIETRETGPYTGSTFTGTVEAARPGLEGRYEFFDNLDSDRHLEMAAGFHSSVTHAGGASIPSNLFSLDWGLNPLRKIEFSGAFYSGQNVAPLGEGYQQGFGFYAGEAEAVHSRGGWGQITLHLLPRVDFHLFSGEQNDRASDLISGRIARNLLFGWNLYFRLAPNVLLGPEITQLRTLYLDQGVRINNHYDLALAYLF
ncbi:MAG TPA: hypothetical protein VME43_24470 [Bryobacteraceae bacterium]|nr:hypothetical protein [Bryobacteraceae bacterium]